MAETDEVTALGSASPVKAMSPSKEVKLAANSEPVTKPATEKKVIEKITLQSDPVKVAKRAERFGLPEKDAVEAKKSKRAMRFSSGGGGGAGIPSTPEIEAKKKARAERFSKGSADVEEKKKARSARFGSVST